ncbi:hypothetical protein UFOVP938_57 [uncultured Caudovirales phage]|uniref:Uncharacterized protein n=1 Tax=uncultured Caudovirales phage TaxID=2100421 RepID=A0A6J5PUG9_9CAUD|nr:hypothetical protein UFOVP596_48 [uncultured Caudovirales phage]CAB4172718.1 hypothetical protein UFOVP938_57 [uncultured Caudovirales phage]CAB4183624.1 hypothetical protein UFOVP1104_44 [uncultured Caudovirales phage]CAB4202981.1 hypothetical protein UFOVP1371_57 [uncultured Caudovirales phage]CAB4214743.1 hypothetical protein UFOVP1468_4 [uncultured Caudovirales phage]
MNKQTVIAALMAFARQRSGIEFCNYGDVSAFRSEQRSIKRDLQHVRVLVSAVQWRDSITGDMIAEACKHAFSGRLSLIERADGKIAVDYCSGQYFPTEYRKAVCAVLASVLWDTWRENMPAPSGKITKTSGFGPFAHESEHDSINGMTPGDYLRATARKEFGRGIASRWFN